MKVYNTLFAQLVGRRGECVTVFNEGGSRSGKTIDTFLFIIDLCLAVKQSLLIYVFRDTLADCKDFTIADFELALTLRPWVSAEITARNDKPTCRIGASVINFRGLDKLASGEGFRSDITYFNELLSGVSEKQFKSATLRCKRMVIADWNPRYTAHWAFNMDGRPNVSFTHTTFRDNPHCPAELVRKILTYEPTPANIAAGTADEWAWKVYGLGVRAAQEGLVFPKITWIDEFPADLEYTVLGMDYGFTSDPTALVREGVRGNDLYLQELFYGAVADPALLYEVIAPMFGKNEHCYADSADKYASNDIGHTEYLQMRDLPVVPVKKYSGCLLDRISVINRFNLHIVKSPNFVNEANAYVWDNVHGIPINKPVDRDNHLWDAVGYPVMMEFRHYFSQ